MTWIKVLSQTDLPAGSRQLVKAGGRDVLLVHHNGHIYAIANRCPHLGASLARGELTGDNAIVCPRHRSAFDLETGDVKAWSPWPPAFGRMLGAVRREQALSVYPIKVEDGEIWIHIGDVYEPGQSAAG
ncbi:MAG TPA: Rieske (2Fe-2S) protein [Chloroflexi bacterium]|nr:Rieske (2Fe-2S) protein [Chloroflexota bacterium]